MNTEKLNSLINEMMEARERWLEWDNSTDDSKFDDSEEEASVRFEDGYSSGIYTALHHLGLLTEAQERAYMNI